MPFEKMVDLTKLRWRIERGYIGMKQEVGPLTVGTAGQLTDAERERLMQLGSDLPAAWNDRTSSVEICR